MRFAKILCAAPVLLGCLAHPVNKQAKPITTDVISEDVWDEMIRWQAIWLASEDFQSLGINKEQFDQINGFLQFSESFLKKAYADKKHKPWGIHKGKKKYKFKLMTKFNQWKGKVIELVDVKNSLKKHEKSKNIDKHAVVGELDKLRQIVASYIEQSNHVPVVTLLRIVGANIEHQLSELREKFETVSEETPNDEHLKELLQRSEDIVRIAELLIKTVDEIKENGVDQFLQNNIGDIEECLGALSNVEFNDSMKIMELMQKDDEPAADESEPESETEPDPDADAELEVKSGSEPESQPEPETKPDAAPGAGSVIVEGPRSTIEFIPEPVSESGTEPDTEKTTKMGSPEQNNQVLKGKDKRKKHRTQSKELLMNHVPAKLKKVVTWFNSTAGVPKDFYLKHTNRQIMTLSMKLFSYIAYQTIGGTMYCLLELAVPKSVVAWDKCGNFHSAQLQKEWILLSLILTRISSPLKHRSAVP